MSAALKAAPARGPGLAAGVRLARTRGFAKRMQRKLLSDLRLCERWDDPLAVPPAARPVLEAAVELVASADDAFEYWPDPERDSRRTLAGRLAWRLHVHASEAAARAERRAARLRRRGIVVTEPPPPPPPDEAEVGEHLALLARVGLLVPLDGGGLRLGVDCRPRPRGGKSSVSALRAETARSNGSKNGEKLRAQQAARPGLQVAICGDPRQPTEGPNAPPKEAPKTPPKETPSEAAAGSGAGSAVGSPPRAPGLSSFPSLAAAAESEESINSFACTAAAAAGSTDPAALKPRAGAGGREAGANTQAGPTEGPKAGPTEGPSEPPTAAPKVEPTEQHAASREAPGDLAGVPDEQLAHHLAFEIAKVIPTIGRKGKGIPGPVAVAEWLSIGVKPDQMLQVTRKRHAANLEQVAAGRAEPIGTFDYLMDAMYGVVQDERPGSEQQPPPAPAAAAPQLSPEEAAKRRAAQKQRNMLSERSKAALQQAIDACRHGDDAALGERIAHLYHWQQSALAVLLDEEPRARALYEQMRRAG